MKKVQINQEVKKDSITTLPKNLKPLPLSIKPKLEVVSPLPNIQIKNPLIQTTTQSRQWQVSILNQELKKNTDINVKITLRIRGEEASSYVPDKLYSSHKYIIEHKINGKAIDQFPLFVSKIQVFHPSTDQEIFKNDKPILSGIIETALTKGKDSLDGKMRVQFTDVSYHHDKGYFYFRISYFDPSNLLQPIIVLKSPPFRVYARKPSIGHETLQPEKVKEVPKKRKKEETHEKKPKHSKLYQEFQKKLDVLVQMKGSLSDEDKKLANESSLEKLLVIDPSYTVDLFLKQNDTPNNETTKM